ncbi:MAG: glycosyltransferase family 4 protein, partial [Bacteroidetes bacterium]|nr:glycosyltransferase family 4 protein [Bacteroidota bacterium]
KKEVSGSYKFIQVNSEGKISFSGKYGPDLLTEIANYSVVASVIAEESEFDLIHAHDWLAYPAGIAAKEVSGKPLVIHVHATDFDRSGGKVNPDVYAIEKRGMDIADLIITVSNLTRDTVINKYHINPAKVFTVYNAVEPLNEIEKAKYKKGTDEKIVTFLGRITFQKGPEYFILAASKILQKMDNVRFVMAGSGDMMNKMILMTARLGITNKFNFTGFLKGDDVYEMLRLSDVYIMPSVTEPFGISPLEALQSNVPVIISNQSGVAEILTHAIKTDFWDIDAIADSIYGILKYPALTKMFKNYGKKEVDELSWENSALKVKEVYDKALSLN